MQKFSVQFKNDNDKKTVMATLLFGIIFGFLSFGVTSFCFGNDLSEESKKIINAFLNFDLILFIICFAIGFIPLVNLLSVLVAPALWIVNLIIILKALKVISDNGKEVEIPVILTIF